MRTVLDIKSIAVLLIPVILIISDVVVIPKYVPPVTPDKVLKWAVTFRKTTETVMLTKNLTRQILTSVPSLIDPFRIAHIKKTSPVRVTKTPEQQKIQFHLSMIILGPKKKLALINNTLVKEGTVIEGYIVQEIAKNHVILIRGREVKKLRLTKGG